MDSSPDLSLKLRRGSNDSRDSYYMDFAQGIDSDIEEVSTIASVVGPVASSAAAPVTVTSPTTTTIPTTTATTIPDERKNSICCTVPEVSDVGESSTSDDGDDDGSCIAITTGPILSSMLTISSDRNDTSTDEDDISPTTPLPMPLLPPIPIQMLPKTPIVDEG